MNCLQLSPLNPLKGRIAGNILTCNFGTNAPSTDGLRVNKYDKYLNTNLSN